MFFFADSDRVWIQFFFFSKFRSVMIAAADLWDRQRESPKMMERLENLTDPSLCLQDLVSSTGSDHHNVALQHASSASFHHPVHDGSAGLHQGMLGHHHVHHHDSHHHHHHAAVPCPPSLLHHEPLEKLKRGAYRCIPDFTILLIQNTDENGGRNRFSPKTK